MINKEILSGISLNKDVCYLLVSEQLYIVITLYLFKVLIWCFQLVLFMTERVIPGYTHKILKILFTFFTFSAFSWDFYLT